MDGYTLFFCCQHISKMTNDVQQYNRFFWAEGRPHRHFPGLCWCQAGCVRARLAVLPSLPQTRARQGDDMHSRTLVMTIVVSGSGRVGKLPPPGKFGSTKDTSSVSQGRTNVLSKTNAVDVGLFFRPLCFFKRHRLCSSRCCREWLLPSY